MPRNVPITVVGLVLMTCAASTSAQLRITTWNVTNYSSGREEAFQTAIYGAYQGRSMSPDVIIGQEFLSQAGVDIFQNLLNSAPGSPGDWAASLFINGHDTDSAFFYRTGKVAFLGVTVVSHGGTSPDHPRNIQRYDIRPVGYSSAGATLACYSSHMKSGSSSDDKDRRLLEAELIRGDAESLPAGWHFLLGADLNIPSSGQLAYQELVGSQEDDAGRFFDPIKTPGSWQNNWGFRFVHTQDPAGAGGMDDRFDQLLLSSGLVDGEGLDYIGDVSAPYSTTTWDDPNHSYRSWGNDGTSFNTSLTVIGNTMVGATIAQALVASAVGQGHLPVYLDLCVPARIESDELIDFGQVQQGAVAEAVLTVNNNGDVLLWTAGGVADLAYSLETTDAFSVPSGPFVESPGAPGNCHVVEMDTSTIGPINGTLTILSNAPDEPVRIVPLLGEVVAAPGDGDFDGDGDVDLDDYSYLSGCLNGPEQTPAPIPPLTPDACLAAFDFEEDGDVDLRDITEFQALFIGQ